jgi:hypothetical protein
MRRMSTTTPFWTQSNLADHHAKRVRETPGCFEDLLGIIGRALTLEEYLERSIQTVADSWCEYEVQARDFVRDSYLNPRAIYADDDLVVAIVDIGRTRFVTCFHEHFDNRRRLHGNHPGRGVSVAQRRLRYLDDLRLKEKGRLIINLRFIRDGQPQK